MVAEQVLALAQQLRRASENGAALRRRHLRPGLGRTGGRRQRMRDFRRAAARDLRHDPIVDRRSLLEHGAAGRGDLDVGNPVRDEGGVGHSACSVLRRLEPGLDGARDRRAVESVVRQHFGIGAAGGHLGESDRRDLRAHARSGQRGGDHHALAELEVVVVERDDRREAAERLFHPRIVDPVEPRQIDHRSGDALLVELLGRFPRVGQQHRAVADDGDIGARPNDGAAADL